MSTPELLRRVAERAGLNPAVSGRLTETALKAIAAQLREAQAIALAEELPPTLGDWVRAAPHGGPRGVAPLLERVAVDEPCSLSFAAEHAAVVCQVLAGALRPEALRGLQLALPDDVAVLLQARPAATAFEHVRVDPRKRTLAEADAPSEQPVFRAKASRG